MSYEQTINAHRVQVHQIIPLRDDEGFCMAMETGSGDEQLHHFTNEAAARRAADYVTTAHGLTARTLSNSAAVEEFSR